jgi:hypothetical protein
MFGNFANTKAEVPEDRLGGGFEPVPSNCYDAVIKLAYAGKAQNSNAQSITLHADVGGKEIRETIFITNRDGENFYKDKDTGKPVLLPGYVTVDDICMFITEQPLSDQDVETKTVKLYDFDQKKEVPTEVPVLTSLIGGKVKLGILREIQDKEKKGDDGKYRPTGETRTQNSIDKVFHPETCRTINEYRAGVETPEFHTAWVERNANKDRNRAKNAGKAGPGQSGTGRPGAGAGSPAPAKSLFSN